MSASHGSHEPAWLADPSGRHQLRWWDGQQWTNHVSTHGFVTMDGSATPTGSAGAVPVGGLPRHPNSVAVLVLGILALFIGLTAPVAWIMGQVAHNDHSGRYDTRNGMLTAGWILGIIVTLFLVAAFLIGVGMGIADPQGR